MPARGPIADDIRANALQLYLSRPLTRTQYAAGKPAILMAGAGARHLGAGDGAAARAALFAGSAGFSATNLSLIPAIALFSLVRDRRSPPLMMLALSSLSKSRWFVAMMYAGLAFFTHAVFGATRLPPRHRLLVDVDFRQSRAGGGRHFPPEAAPRHAAGGLRRWCWPHHRPSPRRFFAGASARSRWSHDMRRRLRRRDGPPVEVVRPGHRAERHHAHDRPAA